MGGDGMKITWRIAAALLGAAAMELIACAAAGKPARDSADVIAESTVRTHMEFLASDAMNGRGSGTRDEWIAATYIGAQLRRCGLQPLDGDYVQTVEIARVEAVGTPTLRVDPGTAIRGEQMLVMHLSVADFRGPLQKFRADAQVRPGVALLMPKDAVPDGAAQAASAGLVLWHETPARRAHWSELSSRVINVGRPRIGGVAAPPGPAQNPPSQIMLADAAYAAISQLEEGSIATLSAATRETLGYTWNAVGTLPGAGNREKDDIILLTAHLDHLGARDTGPDRIYNGADDDASGSTAVLALAEALAKGNPLKRTVVFAWFGSEEAGGYGARYFVEKPVVPLDRIVANLEFEMIGRPDGSIAPHTLWLTGWERTTLGPELAAHGARLVADPHPAEKFFTRSDNFTLARRGVIAQTVSSFGLHADYHQPSDKISRIDFGHMTDAIQSMLAPIRWLADSGFKPDWVQGGRPGGGAL
jgi:aminopeptidase YwaD